VKRYRGIETRKAYRAATDPSAQVPDRSSTRGGRE
jgi:hypothetical protein